MVKAIVFIDSEIGIEDKKIKDLGAVKYNSAPFHSPSVRAFSNYIADCDFICGHNIIHHDLKYIAPVLGNTIRSTVIDTLYLSPLKKEPCGSFLFMIIYYHSPLNTYLSRRANASSTLCLGCARLIRKCVLPLKPTPSCQPTP